MGPRAGLDGCGKSRYHWESIPGPSSPQPVTISTELSRPTTTTTTTIFNNNNNNNSGIHNLFLINPSGVAEESVPL